MNILKFICHCCKRTTTSENMVPCKTPGCDLFFCHRCLTSRYKYSYAKTAKLPTPHWKCPVCTRKCRCTECPPPLPSATVQALLGGKSLVEDNTCAHQQRRKKRIRKGKRKSPDSSLGTGSSLKSPSIGKETLTPPLKFVPPSISSNSLLSFLVFFEAERNKPKPKARDERLQLFPAEVYERMGIGDLLNIVLYPTVHTHALLK